jgi:hypothetical protein
MEAARPRKLLVASGVKGIWYSVTHGEKPGAALTATAPSSKGSLSILLIPVILIDHLMTVLTGDS